jgi:hypothetical protein
VIGSIDTSEFLVAIAASLGFLLALGSQGVDFTWALALLIGGAIAAPIAAWLVRHVPPRLLGSLVGGMIVLTNTRTLLRSDWIDASDPVRYGVYAVIYAVWALAVVHSYRKYRAEQAAEAAEANVVADVDPLSVEAEQLVVEDEIRAGRPSAPRD